MHTQLRHALGATALLLACSVSVQDARAGDDHAEAKRLYDTYCVQCHGVKRNGKGINAAHMSVQPRDHSDPKGMTDIPDKELFTAIADGGLAVDKSVLMPSWKGVLSDQQIHEMVSYLRFVCKCGPGYHK